jgi:trimeric autotransporter adhesin
MNPLIHLKKATASFVVPFVLTWFALSPQARAVCQQGCDSSLFNAFLGDDALISNTTGAGNTALGWRALFTDTDASFSTGVGGGALALNNGDSNTAVGAAALLLNTSGTQNTAVGTDAMVHNDSGSNNNAVGNFALFNNIDGTENNAFGNSALVQNIHASFNTAIGDTALWSNDVTGNGLANQNTAVGASALGLNIDASENTAVGYNALADNDLTGHGTANFNTAIGAEALSFNGDANSNTAVGFNALMNNDIAGNGLANQNTAIGYQALFANTDGGSNTAIGSGALQNETVAGFNTAVGFLAGSNVIDASNVTCVGANVGGANVSNTTWIGNIYGVTTQSGTTAAVIVSDDGQLGTVTSSERFKKDIANMQNASEAILSLRPVTFHYKTDTKGTPQFGLIAEEVAKVNPALVLPDKEGKPYTVRYEQINAMLLNEFLKEHETVEDLKKQVAALTAGLQKVSAQLEVSKAAPQTVLNRR